MMNAYQFTNTLLFTGTGYLMSSYQTLSPRGWVCLGTRLNYYAVKGCSWSMLVTYKPLCMIGMPKIYYHSQTENEPSLYCQ